MMCKIVLRSQQKDQSQLFSTWLQDLRDVKLSSFVAGCTVVSLHDIKLPVDRPVTVRDITVVMQCNKEQSAACSFV
jgi:hypothetical protein